MIDVFKLSILSQLSIKTFWQFGWDSWQGSAGLNLFLSLSRQTSTCWDQILKLRILQQMLIPNIDWVSVLICLDCRDLHTYYWALYCQIQTVELNSIFKYKKGSSRGVVVKAEDSWPTGPGFKPPLWRPFFRHHSFGSKLGTKFVENL